MIKGDGDMTSNLTRANTIHVDVIGDKNGAPRVQSLGTASILGILPEGHMWTVAGPSREAECCGTFHVDVEGQTTYIRCVTTGHTILSSRGLVKTLQMMADLTNTPVIIGHDPGASSTIKNAKYTPSGKFAPVAPVALANAVTLAVGDTVVTSAGDVGMVEARYSDGTVNVFGIVACQSVGVFYPVALTVITEDMTRDAQNVIKQNGRVFVAEADNFGGSAVFAVLVAHGWATLVNDGDMSRWVRTRYTADRKRITDGLAVWDYNLNPGRVVLATIDGEGWFNVDTADGRSLMNGERVITVHPSTRQDAADAMAADEAPFEVPTDAEVDAWRAGAEVTEVTEDVWAGAGLIRTMTGKTLWTETRNGITRIKASTGRFTEWDAEQFTELVDLGVLSVPTVTLSQPLRTLVNRRKRKASKVNARRVRGGV